ncbi:MAG: hypothetical protein LDL13_05520, partial [Calditerrivibrio sp.]|nr:hypothetical protein [Calditerrivibrio sp.]
DDYAKLYLLNIMKGLMDREDFFYTSIVGDDSLGEAFMKAFSRDLLGKVQSLKAVGDLCLVYSGFFPDRFNRKLVDIDYFMKLGQVSFLTLHKIYNSMNSLSDLKNLYLSVYREFTKIVTVMLEIAKIFKLLDKDNLLKVYERWQKTGISTLYNILKESKIIPLQNTMSKSC